MKHYWYSKDPQEIFQILHSDEHGLSQTEALKRLDLYGPNKLPEEKREGLWIIFFRQFQSPLIYILFTACVIIFLMGEIVDASIILAILIFNSIIGTIQEGRAQNTLVALKKFVETKATILRENNEIIVPDTEVVPGDIIVLQEGERIPADARVLVSHGLNTDEAAITGESTPKHKIIEPITEKDLPDADQKNIVFKGTNIVSGNGKALVVATGAETVIGKIARQIATIDAEIPLKKDIRNLSRVIIIAVAIISVILFILGISSGKTVEEMFATVVSLAVSVIPEGLPVVITLVLATGVWRMSKQNVLVKKLQAVEALGQARVIAVDKTGTITKNELVIRKVYVDGNIYDVGGIGYEPKGGVTHEDNVVNPHHHPGLVFSAKIAAFCASARLMFSQETSSWRVTGDPTEAAMLVFAEKLGFNKEQMERTYIPVSEIPFDYKLKYHATAHDGGNEKILTVVGAPEVMVQLSTKILIRNTEHQLTPDKRDEIEREILRMSEEGLRVIAFATSSQIPETLKPETLPELTLVGLFGMKDALRSEVAVAMEKTKLAGIRVVMITGDHRVTAQAIAKEAGIWHEGDEIISGDELEKLYDHELSEKLSRTTVFARVTPEHKLRIIEAYKARGEVIAMTGDGVNDAPSLVAADLGVAMGKIGTEVAKEASDIILLDDNFGSIVSAVEEGRSIYKTIRKVILYLFSTSAGEVLAISGAIVVGFPLLLLPAHIIWLNFVTDVFLVVALAMEPKEKGLLRGTFKRPPKYLVDGPMTRRILVMAIPMAIGTLLFFKGYLDGDMVKAWTIALTLLAVFQWFNAWNCRSETESVFTVNPFSNKFLTLALVGVVSLQAFIIYNPLAQKIFRTTALAGEEWLIIIAIASSIVFVEEIRKFFVRRRLRFA